MLRGRRWTGILWRGVLGYVLPRLSFLWSYGVFRYSVSLRVITVFRDITYVIIILYSWHLVICEHFWLYVWNNWSWVMHTMSTWLWHKNCVWNIKRWCLHESARAWHSRLWTAASGRARQVTLDHIDPVCFLFLCSSHIGLHALILLPKHHTFWSWVFILG
jgi:hypothetical protein